MTLPCISCTTLVGIFMGGGLIFTWKLHTDLNSNPFASSETRNYPATMWRSSNTLLTPCHLSPRTWGAEAKIEETMRWPLTAAPGSNQQAWCWNLEALLRMTQQSSNDCSLIIATSVSQTRSWVLGPKITVCSVSGQPQKAEPPSYKPVNRSWECFPREQIALLRSQAQFQQSWAPSTAGGLLSQHTLTRLCREPMKKLYQL